MKASRLFVLLLLAMLLPLRGVAAVAWLCEQQPASHTESVVPAHGHDMAKPAVEDDSQQHDPECAGADKARLCQASCAATPLMSALPAFALPTVAGATVFPHVAAPAPTFLSDGQDRPPRSI